jgi:erythritol transport system permease protein
MQAIRCPNAGIRVAEVLIRLRALIALGVLVVVFSLLSSEFLTAGNLAILIKHVAINAILAIGMTFVILSGGIDLSVGSIAGLCGMVADIRSSRKWPAAGVTIISTPGSSWSRDRRACRSARERLLIARLQVAPFMPPAFCGRAGGSVMSGGAPPTSGARLQTP